MAQQRDLILPCSTCSPGQEMKLTVFICLFALASSSCAASLNDEKSLSDSAFDFMLTDSLAVDLVVDNTAYGSSETVDPATLKMIRSGIEDFAKDSPVQIKNAAAQILNEKLRNLRNFFGDLPNELLLPVAKDALKYRQLMNHLNHTDLSAFKAEEIKALFGTLLGEEIAQAIDALVQKAALVDGLTEDQIEALLDEDEKVSLDNLMSCKRKILTEKSLESIHVELKKLDVVAVDEDDSSRNGEKQKGDAAPLRSQDKQSDQASAEFKYSLWISVAIVATMAVSVAAYFGVKSLRGDEDLEEIEV